MRDSSCRSHAQIFWAAMLLIGCILRPYPASSASVFCHGDCDGSGDVTVNEIISLVNIALGNAKLSDCTNGILSGADVDVVLIIQAVNNALDRCPTGSETKTPSPTPTPGPMATPTLGVETAVTGSEGTVEVAGGDLRVHVIDFGTQEPIQNIQVTLLDNGSEQDVIVVDPAGEYAAHMFIASRQEPSTIARYGRTGTTPSTLQVSLIGRDYITAQGSTLPFILNGSTSESIFDWLSSQFVTCETTTFGEVDDLIRQEAEDLIVEEQLSGVDVTATVELILLPLSPEIGGALLTLEAVTTVTRLAAAGLSGIEYDAYRARGYQPADLFAVCHANSNFAAQRLLDHGFFMKPIAAPRQGISASGLISQWVGNVYQPNPGSRYRAVMTINALNVGEVAGSSEYPTLGCGGTLTYLGQTSTGRFDFREHITTGTDRCVDDVLISASFISADKLNWEAFAGSIGAFGSLTRDAWRVWIDGSGPTIDEENGRLEVKLPADSAPSPDNSFGAFYEGVCQFQQGDFDMQVDFQYLEAPALSGARVGILVSDRPNPPGITSPGTVSVVRASRGQGEITGRPNDVYSEFDGSSGMINDTATTDQSGTVRLVRTGNALVGYYLSSGNWVALGAGFPAPASIVNFSIGAWSNANGFRGQQTRVALSNFVINQGALICPPGPPPTPIPTPP